MKFQLTISTGYVSDWGIWEGVREIVQNHLDAKDDGHPGKISYRNGVVRVTTEGVKLDSSVWLLGTSSKSDGGYRGHFGEGLKLGVMALVRAGCSVKIINDDESWSPKIEASEAFGSDVLTIYTYKRQKSTGRFSVEIEGVDEEMWATIQERFISLKSPEQKIHTAYGDVILDPEFQGKIFVKGIYVQNKELRYSYDFSHARTDRDRKMVEDFDIKYYAAKAWEEAMTRQPSFASTVLSMLEDESPELSDFGSFSVSEQASELLAQVFHLKYGEAALPVSNMADSREAAHMGKNGVVVPLALVRSIKSKTGDIETVKTEFASSVTKTYGWSDLSDDEKAMYEKVLGLVSPAAESLGHQNIETRLQIVDFNDPALCGTHKAGEIKLAKKMLESFEDALSTLVHEVAHDHGGDGEVGHERAEGALFSRIVSSLI